LFVYRISFQAGEAVVKYETRAYIDDLAQSVIDYFKVSVPIRDIEAAVNAMGGSIEPASNFDELIDGSIQKNGNDRFLIRIATGQSDRRKNFTIAHELGHLFLHMGYHTNPDVWARQQNAVYLRFGASEAEYQANEFAAALLMPPALFKRKVEQYSKGNNVSIQLVADYFNVSIAAAVNRGKFLGIFAW
jgi:Zn-dependent peptidase ImmA (M78 family)